MTQNIITLDVREEFRSGRKPCDKIHGALKQVGDGRTLRLLVPFEPVPLFELSRNQGLTHDAKLISNGDWEVLFSRATKTDVPIPQRVKPNENSCGCGCHETEPAETVQVDARGLEPPQPMVKVLEALATLPEQAEMHARTDLRPIHLYPMLEARGFAGESEEQPDGSYVTYIRHR